MSIRPMAARYFLPVLVCASLATPALAQSQPEPEIDYEAGQYEYAQIPEDGDDAVTIILPEPAEPRPAVRIIPVRQTGPVPVFVSNPVIQPIAPEQSLRYVQTAPAPFAVAPAPATVYFTMPVLQPAPVIYPFAPAAPASFAYPGGGAARVIYPADRALPAYAYPQAYAAAAGALPAGARLVTFDRAAWLAECRYRLAGYAPHERESVIAALGAAAAGYMPGRDHCASYLDSYLASAAAGTLMVSPQYGRQYMLVPVTAMVPQAPARPGE